MDELITCLICPMLRLIDNKTPVCGYTDRTITAGLMKRVRVKYEWAERCDYPWLVNHLHSEGFIM